MYGFQKDIKKATFWSLFKHCIDTRFDWIMPKFKFYLDLYKLYPSLWPFFADVFHKNEIDII